MSEILIFDTPLNADAGLVQMRVAEFHISVPNRTIEVWFIEANPDGSFAHASVAACPPGRMIYHRWDNAQVLIKALNKANLPVKSLERRLIEQYQAAVAGAAGPVVGAPD